MMAMSTTSSNPQQLTAAELSGVKVEYGHLPALNPNDLKPPTPTKNAKIEEIAAPIDLGEVYNEIKQKLRESIVGSSVSNIMLSIRVCNLIIAWSMITIALCQMILTSSFWNAVHDVFSVLYTLMFAIILVGYEMRTMAVDEQLRANFGFMYGPWGRCLFLCLISIFPLGMQGVYGVLVSALGFINAYFNYFVITKHPSFTRGVPDYVPPETVKATPFSSKPVGDDGEEEEIDLSV